MCGTSLRNIHGVCKFHERRLLRCGTFHGATCARILALLMVALAACRTIGIAAAADTKRPNILLAIADDWSFGHATAYGCAWAKTPGFDRVAREGLLFTRAYTP